jgi:glutathione reductase (NADPH)
VTEALDWARRLHGKGLASEALRVDWAAMMAFKRTFTDVMPGRIEHMLDEAGVRTIHGSARFAGPNEVTIEGDVSARVRAHRIHIAVGARPRRLDIPGEGRVVTSTDFLELPTLPRRVCFIGGGFISFEFSHVARRAGAEEVTILHRGSRPLDAFDADLVERLVTRTRALGVNVQLDACVTAVEAEGGSLRVRYDGPDGEHAVLCDLVVHGAGRAPNLDELGLGEAGIDYGPRGVHVTRALRSVSNPAVWAAGDAADTGAPALTPVSGHDARVAAENIIANADVADVAYPPVPSVVFTVPPLARVGMLESEAEASGLEYDVHFKADTGGWYSSLRVAEPCSGFKLLVEKKSGRILGAHLLGPGAEEQVNVLAMVMKAGLTAKDVKGTIFAYPSFSSDLASFV